MTREKVRFGCEPRITRVRIFSRHEGKIAPPDFESSAGGRRHARIDRDCASIQRCHRECAQIGKNSWSDRRRQPGIGGNRGAGLDGQIIGPVIGKRDSILHQVWITCAITHFHRPHHDLRVQVGRGRIQQQRIARPDIGWQSCACYPYKCRSTARSRWPPPAPSPAPHCGSPRNCAPEGS